MRNLAETLKPPFYAAVIDNGAAPESGGLAPSDELISIAPAQAGFLGLETARDKNGTPVTISYWSDLAAEKTWERKGDDAIRAQFGGRALAETCAIRVSRIDHKIDEERPLRAEQKAIAKGAMGVPLGALVLSAFPSLAGLLGYETV